ncbi:vitamin K epoxide reductase family protein [Dactylosporangium sp. NPDC000521]|uniref:vitamin K epoxide reductase family protein n=1 Tax=Dactylosporangium sp. NPDC000521 TaxID=3363975 RepID=UPI0036854883
MTSGTNAGLLSRRAWTPPWWWRRALAGPSAWPRRVAVAVLACAGLLISLRLAFFQYGLVPAVWEPWFGDGSVRVLESGFSRALPVHDAALGAAAYLVEFVLELSGGTTRWWRRPWLVVLLGLVAGGMAVAALFLVALQAFVIGAFCTLCLVSAAISLVVPLFVAEEVAAVWRQLRRARRYGRSWAAALRGGDMDAH